MANIKPNYAWVGLSNGYASINWHADNPEYYDWVGLYADQNKGQDDWLSWQWVSKSSSYVTSTILTEGLSVRYYTWNGDYSKVPAQRPVLLDELDDKGERIVTPTSLLASISGVYVEVMRTRNLSPDGEVNASGEHLLHPGCWVTCSTGGYAELNWTAAEDAGGNDWVALYQDVEKGNGDYISGAWQWAIRSPPYVTSVNYQPGIHARYIKEGKPYIALRRSKPIGKDFFDLENIYYSTESKLLNTTVMDVKKIVTIMADQLRKFLKGEPSIFSPHVWPFPDNLLFKNLSSAEVKVIGRMLRPSQYYDVIMVYYETYIIAINIADDGERNAKRHAFWQISMFQKFGEYFAKEIGDAHEIGRPGTAEDNRVDELNNAAAIQYAKDNPGVDPASAANKMWSLGLLTNYNDAVAPEHTKDEL